jgi:tetratricopeptide (TPR) repeat protein
MSDAPSDPRFQERIESLVLEGEVDTALAICDAALVAHSSPGEQAVGLCVKANVLLATGERGPAAEILLRALAIAESEKDVSGDMVANIHYSLSVSMSSIAREASKAHAMKALQAFEGMAGGDLPSDVRINLQGILGQLYEVVGRYADAVRCYELVMGLAELPRDQVMAAKAIAELSRATDEYTVARRRFEKARAMAERVPSTRADVLSRYAEFEWDHGNHDHALSLYRGALECLPDAPVLSRHDGFKADLYWRLARLYYARKRYKRAMRYAGQVIEIAPRGSRLWGGAHVVLGHALAHFGARDLATRSYREALAAAGMPEDEIESAREGLRDLDGARDRGASGRDDEQSPVSEKRIVRPADYGVDQSTKRNPSTRAKSR